jgi:hypothetical protein
MSSHVRFNSDSDRQPAAAMRMPAPMMVMKYPHRLGCINSGGISYAWCH